MQIIEKLVIAKYDDRVWSIAFCKNTQLLVVTSILKVHIWKINFDQSNNISFQFLYELDHPHKKTVRNAKWSSNGDYLALVSFDSFVSIWKVTELTGKGEHEPAKYKFTFIENLIGHEKEVKSVSWHSDSEHLASCSRDQSVWIWKYDQDDCFFENESVLYQHTQDVKHVVFHPNLLMLVSCSYDNKVNIYRPDTNDYEWYRVDTLTAHNDTVWCADFNSQGSYLATVGNDLNINIWDVNKFKHLEDFAKNEAENNEPTGQQHPSFLYTYENAHTEPIYAVKWLPNSNFLITASGDNSIALFKFQDQILTNIFVQKEAHSQDINSIDLFQQNDRIYLISCSDDGQVKCWEIIQTGI